MPGALRGNGVGCGVRSAARRRREDKPGGDDHAWSVKRAPLTHGSGAEQPQVHWTRLTRLLASTATDTAGFRNDGYH